MSSLPSLKSLQAFEAAARTGSFVSAAAELSVTPAAISQLVRTLERQVGRQLFLRVNRGIAPSEAALEVLPRLHTAFEELGDVSSRLAGRRSLSRLTVSVPPSVATGWLCHHLASFIGAQEPLAVSIRGEEDPVSFDRDRIDFRLSFGRFHYCGHDTAVLLSDAVYPVCSPAFLSRAGPLGMPQHCQDAALIHTDWGPAAATFPSWRSWFEQAGIQTGSLRRDRGLVANSSKAAIDLATNGLGMALCQGLLAAQPLRDGTLVIPNAHSLPLSQPYCYTVPERSALRPIVSTFSSWFAKACATSAAEALAASESANG